ncbi:hypothetical protein ACFLWN_04815, partial [Chloroflexota bacterium]
MLSSDLSLLASIILVLVLVRLKLHVGMAIFAGSILLSVFTMPLVSIFGRMLDSLFGFQTIRLMVIICSSMALSSLMEKKGLL